MEKKISPDLEKGNTPLIPVIHDESFFSANDGRTSAGSTMIRDKYDLKETAVP